MVAHQDLVGATYLTGRGGDPATNARRPTICSPLENRSIVTTSARRQQVRPEPTLLSSSNTALVIALAVVIYVGDHS